MNSSILKMRSSTRQCLFLSLCLWAGSCRAACTDPPGITLLPPHSQLVPINTDTNVTYTCTVDSNRRAEWEFRGVQIPSDSPNIMRLADSGIHIVQGANYSETLITVTQTGREVYGNQDLIIVCTAITEEGRLDIEASCFYSIRTFDVPNIPRNFEFNPFPGNTSRLVLTWDEPDNIITDTDVPVVMTYLVTVSGATFNFNRSITERRVEFVDSVTSDCAMHDFTVSASNEAGQGMSVTINATIPISPDIVALNATLSVSKVVLSPNIIVEVTFSRSIACSPRFQLQAYMVTVGSMVPVSYPSDAEQIAGKEVVSLNVTGSSLQQNTVYSLFVSACISVTCRHSEPVQFRTTDVQSASVIFFDTNIMLSCSFASSSSALGCMFIFTVSVNDTETFVLSKPQGQVSTTQCNVTMNMENAYASIEVVDWELGGSYGGVVITPRKITLDNDTQYTSVTDCPLPTASVASLSTGGIVGVVVAVLVLLIVSAIIIVIIAITAKLRVDKENEKAKTERVDLDCAVSLLGGGGGDEVDGPEGASGGPPNPNIQPLSFQFRLDTGRKDGTFVINKNFLKHLQERIENEGSDKVELLFSVP